jgi:hypothetical protein
MVTIGDEATGVGILIVDDHLFEELVMAVCHPSCSADFMVLE